VKRFSKETALEFVAPISLRLGAALFDYSLLLAPPVFALAVGRLIGLDGSRLTGSSLVSIGWFLTLLFFLVNQILFPILTGQTAGKRFLGLRVIDLDGRIPDTKAVLKRNILGYFLNFVTVGLTFMPAVGSMGRGLHDRISGTIVVRAKSL
jgi:uncharacterized RDD family membrane protein YckC